MIAVLVAAHAVAAPSPDAATRRIDEILREERLTGAVWSLVRDGQIFTGAAGVRDARSGAALEPGHRVQVGSVAKTVFAAGILRVASEGRLSLDAPVAAFLPGMELRNPWAATDPLRLRHLLDQTSGLADARLRQIFSLRADADDPLLASFAGDAAILRIRHRPGSRFSYSNVNYALLGAILERVTGERYETYLDRELLAPLGLRDSTFRFVAPAGAGGNGEVAMGHFEGGEAHTAVPTALRSATQFTTTAADMARFAEFLMSDGELDGKRFIAPELLRAMGRPQDTEAARAGLVVGYALGLNTRDRHGVIGRCHSGNTVGFMAMFCLFPEQRRAFFVAVNTDSETADYGRIDAALIAALGVTRADEVPRSMAKADFRPWEGFYVLAPNRFASVDWFDFVFGFQTLRDSGAGVRLTPLSGAPLRLTPVEGGLLRLDGRAIASHALLRSADGARVLTTGTRTFERVPAWRLGAAWTSLIGGTLGIAWILLRGLVKIFRWSFSPSTPVFAPFLALFALLLPVPLFVRQSFLELGDVTAASVALAVVTALLPLALVLGLAVHWRRRDRAGSLDRADAVAMLAGLQWIAVLAIEGLVPLRLFAA